MKHQFSTAGLLLLSVFLIVGCGSSGTGPERIAVSGKVERLGQPMWGSSISFLPAQGHDGPAATANIEDGRYSFTKSNGPVAGAHRVVISVNPSKGIMARTPDDKEPPGQSVPTGGPWEFEVEVPAENSFQKDFSLD